MGLASQEKLSLNASGICFSYRFYAAICRIGFFFNNGQINFAVYVI
jgi:hypothetical protein